VPRRGIHSILAEATVGVVAGFGVRSYVLGLEAMLAHVQNKRPQARAKRSKKAKRTRR